MLTPEPRVKIKAYKPLILMCAQCGVAFDASVRSGEEIEAEIEQHMREHHTSESQAA
jgi:predicted small metal-binding protein